MEKMKKEKYLTIVTDRNFKGSLVESNVFFENGLVKLSSPFVNTIEFNNLQELNSIMNKFNYDYSDFELKYGVLLTDGTFKNIIPYESNSEPRPKNSLEMYEFKQYLERKYNINTEKYATDLAVKKDGDDKAYTFIGLERSILNNIKGLNNQLNMRCRCITTILDPKVQEYQQLNDPVENLHLYLFERISNGIGKEINRVGRDNYIKEDEKVEKNEEINVKILTELTEVDLKKMLYKETFDDFKEVAQDGNTYEVKFRGDPDTNSYQTTIYDENGKSHYIGFPKDTTILNGVLRADYVEDWKKEAPLLNEQIRGAWPDGVEVHNISIHPDFQGYLPIGHLSPKAEDILFENKLNQLSKSEIEEINTRLEERSPELLFDVQKMAVTNPNDGIVNIKISEYLNINTINAPHTFTSVVDGNAKHIAGHLLKNADIPESLAKKALSPSQFKQYQQYNKKEMTR